MGRRLKLIGTNPKVNKEMKLSACGRKCFECSTYSFDCLGCYHTREIIIKKKEKDMCPIYECVMNRNKERSCKNCEELPCELFDLCGDSEMTRKERKGDIRKRVLRLKKEF